MLSRADRWWLAWRILRSELISFKADPDLTTVVLEFRGRDRVRLQDALRPPRAQ